MSNFWNSNYIEYQSNGHRNKNLTLEEYINQIKPYLKDIVIDFQEFDTWKIQLAIAINFISSKDAEKERVMDSKREYIELAFYNESLHSRYQGN